MDGHDRPRIAARRIRPGSEDECEDDRGDEADDLGQPIRGTSVSGMSLRPTELGQSTLIHARDPSRTAPAAAAGARTGDARQWTADASTRLGTARTR